MHVWHHQYYLVLGNLRVIDFHKKHVMTKNNRNHNIHENDDALNDHEPHLLLHQNLKQFL